jgi:hypothetical protein
MKPHPKLTTKGEQTMTTMTSQIKEPVVKTVTTQEKSKSRKTRLYIFSDIWETEIGKAATSDAEIAEIGKVMVRRYRKVLPEILKQAGIPEAKASWSWKAGCSCGCTPGFILDKGYGMDIFVDVSFA